MEQLTFQRRYFIDTFLSSPVIIGRRDSVCHWINHPHDETNNASIQLSDLSLINSIVRFKELPSSWKALPLQVCHYQQFSDSLPKWDIADTLHAEAMSSANALMAHAEAGMESTLGCPITPKTVLSHTSDTSVYRTLKGRGEYLQHLVDSLAVVKARTARGALVTSLQGWTWALNDSIVLVSPPRGALDLTHCTTCWMMHQCDSPPNSRAIKCPHQVSITGRIILLSFNQLLMIKDRLLARANTYLVSSVVYPDSATQSLLSSVYHWMDTVLSLFGNEGFSLAKEVESVARANLTDMVDPVFTGKGSYQHLIALAAQKEQKLIRDGWLHPVPWPGVHSMSMALHHLMKEPINLIEACEMFGLQKLAGHPLIDPYRGGVTAATAARSPTKTTFAAACKLRWNLRRMIVEGYISQKKKWPRMRFSASGRRTRLYELYSLQDTSFHRRSTPLEDWEHVRFTHILDFNYFPNFLDLMDDKSISLYRDEVNLTWDKGKAPRSQRRLLLEMLTRPEVSIKDIVDLVDSGWEPLWWKVISLFPKEREFKLAARMFAMLVFERRALHACMEHNLAEGVFPYLRQQTMTMRRDQIQLLFHSLTAPVSDPDTARLFIEVDLQSWNHYWRDLPVRMVGSDFDDLFGMKRIYASVHDFFEESLIVVRVPDERPTGIELDTPPESDLAWTGHAGGLEGQVQKEWTAPTLSMLDLGMAEHDCPYTLVGQADNQIVVVLLNTAHVTDKGRYIRDKANQITASIDRSCEAAGQHVKTEESVKSTRVITYSKNVHIITNPGEGGVEFYTTIKAFSRIFNRAAVSFPDVGSIVASIHSACIAAAESSKVPFQAYWFATYYTTYYLRMLRHRDTPATLGISRKGLRILCDQKLIAKILVTPAELGGFPISTPLHYLYKGGGDPLAKSVGGVFLLSRHNSNARRLRAFFEHTCWWEPHPRPEAILQDPFSIPLNRPTSSVASVDALTQDQLLKVTSNLEIRELLSTEANRFSKDLISALLTVTPFNPILLADILSSSVSGVIKTISKMFVATRTVQDFSARSEGEDIPSQAIEASARYTKDTLERMLKWKDDRPQINTPYEFCEFLRRKWVYVLGKCPVGVTAYSPMDFSIHVSLSPQRGPGIRALALTKGGGISLRHQRGPFSPYLGIPTKEHRSEHGYRIIRDSSAATAIDRLHVIASQSGLSKEFRHLLSLVALTRSPVDFSAILPFLSDVEGGDIGHRYSARLAIRNSYTMVGTAIASLISIVTDYCNDISASTDDYPVSFQEQMCYIIGVLNLILHLGKDGGVVFVRLALGEYPLTPLPDETLVYGGDPISTLTLPWNSLAYARTIDLVRVVGPSVSYMCGTMTEPQMRRLSLEPALQGTIRRQIARAQSTASVLDKHLGVIGLHLDVLELRGFGIEKVILFAARQIATTAIRRFLSSPGRRVRTALIAGIHALCGGVARGLLTYIRHPLIAQLLYSERNFQISPLRYDSDNMRSERIAATLVQQTLRLLYNPASSLYTHKVVVFRDDHDLESSEIIMECAMVALYRSVLSHELPARLLLPIVRTNLLGTVRGKHTGLERMAAMYREFLCIVQWAGQHGLVGLSTDFQAIVRGDRLSLFNLPVSATTRWARESVIEDSHTRRRDVAPSPILCHHKEVHCWRTLSPHLACNSNLNPPDIHEPILLTDMDLTRERFMRLLGRPVGGEASGLYTWCHIPPDSWVGREVVVVGMGHGAAAATALACGAAWIYGLDLLSDIRIEESLRDEAPPYLLRMIGVDSAFSRISPESGGDWSVDDPLTTDTIRKLIGPGSLVVIDIPRRTLSSLLTLAENLLTGKSYNQALVRLVAPPRDILWFGYTCGTTGATISISVVGEGIDTLEALVAIKGMSTPARALFAFTYNPSDLTRCCSHNCSTGPSYTHLPSQDYLTMRAYHGYQELTSQRLQEAEGEMFHAVRTGMDTLTHQYSYTEWTKMLNVVLADWLLSLSNAVRITTCLHLLTLSTFVIPGTSITIEISQRTISIISRLISRLTRCPH